jgi:hypothetical protein
MWQPGNQILILDQCTTQQGGVRGTGGDVGFMMKAILNGSMHHNMRDGCTTRQDGVFPEEALLEIMDR